MKGINLVILFSLMYNLIWAQPRIEPLELAFDYGNVIKGGSVQHDFKFVNTGNEPLIILKAKTSCGCDVPIWSKEPVLPGDTAVVNYKYDSKRIGIINKSMTIYSNDTLQPYIVVRNKGNILPKQE